MMMMKMIRLHFCSTRADLGIQATDTSYEVDRLLATPISLANTENTVRVREETVLELMREPSILYSCITSLYYPLITVNIIISFLFFCLSVSFMGLVA